ncbi:MAG: uncharacterized lipoprotein YddW (UPF0748 family) [Algoriphagus sp.]|jgi:uncharacterized lipoprotein YddW (UPF0748 family)
MLRKLSIVFVSSVLFSTCTKTTLPLKIDVNVEGPIIISENTEVPKREFRGAWVASIANIDWPSQKGLSSVEQKKEYDAIVKHHKSLGINALLVQVRAASDAFYIKSKEPWSEWLMGEQGKAPEPLYDPMVYMIKKTHENGLEFHAWLNLNRGKHRLASSITKDHLIYRKPEWFLSYGDYELYDFGLPEVRQYILDMVMNIVREYDVDGVHFDDYFYPYKVNELVLNDESTFEKYGGQFSNIEDWRRNNIDIIIKSISEAIKKEKSWVSYGISPFGVWRNKSEDSEGSETRGGQPSYDFLFADTRKWAQEGWIDYIAPQIYFPFEHKLVPYGTLTDWWATNHGKANLYIGHGVYRVDEYASSSAWADPNQIARQLDYNRYTSEVSGSIFYNTNSLIRNNLGMRDSIKVRYEYPALPPIVKGNLNTVPKPEKFEVKNAVNGTLLTWASGLDEVVLYRFKKGEELNVGDPKHIIFMGKSQNFLDKNVGAYVYLLSRLNRWNQESDYLLNEN